MSDLNSPVATVASAVPQGFRGLQLLAVTDGIETWHVERNGKGGQYLLRQPTVRGSRETTRQAIEELQRELHLTRMASSPYVRRAVHAELNQSRCYLLSDWLEGTTLEAHLSRSMGFDWKRSLWMARQCASGLADLQAAGFEHRAIAASQVWLTPEGRALWFDLRHIVDRSLPAEVADPRVASSDPNLLVYLPPEALVGDARRPVFEDMYSLGVLLYRIFTGKLPFVATTREMLTRLVRSSSVPGVCSQNPRLPAQLDRLVQSMMAKQPLRRPTHFSDVVAELIPLELESILSAV